MAKKCSAPKFSAVISDFVKMMEEASKDYAWNYDEVNRMDRLTQDYLHKLELDNLDYKERAKVATQIAKCRQARRACWRPVRLKAQREALKTPTPSMSLFLAKRTSGTSSMLDLIRACRINSAWLILQRVTRSENSAYSSSVKRVLITRWRWGVLYLFMAVNLLSWVDFFKRRKPQKGGLGVATPTRFP